MDSALSKPSSYRRVDDTAYLLLLTDPDSSWLFRSDAFGERMTTPSIADLLVLCSQRDWSAHIWIHRDSHQVLLKPLRKDEPYAQSWDPTGPISTPEHALVILMNRANKEF